MIKSMTGFASLTREGDTATVTATVKGVNHRFLDLQLRTPSALAPIETRLRSFVQQRVARGRVELTVTVQSRRQPVVDVEVNDAILEALSAALDRARERGLVTGPLSPGDVLRFPQAVCLRERADAADSAAADGAEILRARLHERVKELQADTSVDEAAVAQEIVRFANRSDITEETVRFRAHLEHWRSLSDSPEPCGRKLDFLLQEMNREVNTLGSKAEGAGVAELVVALKAELEKMREQVQNVE